MQIGLSADVSDYVLRVFVNKVMVKQVDCRGRDSNCALSSNGYPMFLFGVRKWEEGRVMGVG
jgi:hypothetical protein